MLNSYYYIVQRKRNARIYSQCPLEIPIHDEALMTNACSPSKLPRECLEKIYKTCNDIITSNNFYLDLCEKDFFQNHCYFYKLKKVFINENLLEIIGPETKYEHIFKLNKEQLLQIDFNGTIIPSNQLKANKLFQIHKGFLRKTKIKKQKTIIVTLLIEYNQELYIIVVFSNLADNDQTNTIPKRETYTQRELNVRLKIKPCQVKSIIFAKDIDQISAGDKFCLNCKSKCSRNPFFDVESLSGFFAFKALDIEDFKNLLENKNQ